MAQTSKKAPAEATAPPASPQQDLVNACQGLVRSIAWKIHRKLPPQVELDDLISYGQVGLIQAARDFDSDRGNQFTTFAYHRVRGAIMDGLSQMSWFSRYHYHRSTYERTSGDLLASHADDAAADSASQPTLHAESTWFTELVARLSISYLSAGSGANDADKSGQVADDGASPSAEVIAREMRDNLRRLVDELPDASRSLIRSAYFDGVTLQEAGKRLGISKAWASRLHAKALDQLARKLRKNRLDED